MFTVSCDLTTRYLRDLPFLDRNKIYEKPKKVRYLWVPTVPVPWVQYNTSTFDLIKRVKFSKNCDGNLKFKIKSRIKIDVFKFDEFYLFPVDIGFEWKCTAKTAKSDNFKTYKSLMWQIFPKVFIKFKFLKCMQEGLYTVWLSFWSSWRSQKYLFAFFNNGQVDENKPWQYL